MDVQQIVMSPKSQSPINKASSSVYPFSVNASSPTNINGNNLHDHDSHYFEEGVSEYPVGYRFMPTDQELVGYYLRRKVANYKLPKNMTANEVELYKYSPQYLAANYEAQRENEWYLFTPRDRKYPNGKRPNRAAGDGYWKATGADKPVVYNRFKIGFKKSLVFYQGKPPGGVKTDWIMHEYRLNQPPKEKASGSDMRLDDWVLCKLYNKNNKNPLKNEKKKLQDVRDLEIVEEDGHEVPVNKSGIDHQTSVSTINNIDDSSTSQYHHVNDHNHMSAHGPHNHMSAYDPHNHMSAYDPYNHISAHDPYNHMSAYDPHHHDSSMEDYGVGNQYDDAYYLSNLINVIAPPPNIEQLWFTKKDEEGTMT